MAICLNCNRQFPPIRQSYGKYCSNKCQKVYEYQQWMAQVEKSGKFPSTRQATPRQRRYLSEKQCGQCAICKRKTWLGHPIPLAFDHVNGDHTDWRLTNCRMICNNCDALQPTFKGRNRGKGRSWRKKYTAAIA